MSGILPPPGVYFQSDTFYYQGSAQAKSSFSRGASRRNVNFEIAGVPVAGLEAEALIEMATGTWIAKPSLLGGNLGLAYTQGVGWLEVAANVGASGTGELSIGPISRTLSFARTAEQTDDLTGFADPYFTALLGWHAGNLHWNLNAGLNVPAGDWELGRLANLGFNRWALDVGVAATWLNEKIGLELTAAPGITFNDENPDTNYRTGTEFHVEFAAMQFFTPKLALGVSGYYYKQVTGDSGLGARLGGFKGRVPAIGPDLIYNFNVHGVPVTANARWMHEFNVQRRLKGDVGLLTIAFPLSGAGG